MSPEPLRVAAYYAPAAEDALAEAAASWLGRDAATGTTRTQPDLPEIAAITADARRYGFHATLKPPMRLIPGARLADVLAATQKIASGIAAFALPALSVQAVHGFVALRERTPCQNLQDLADACVGGLDALRAPPDAAELARRRRSPLSPLQDAMLQRWGYPYVFQTWFFHMTLTCRLEEAARAAWIAAAQAHFAAALAQPRRVEAISLFVQDEAGAPFRIAARVALSG